MGLIGLWELYRRQKYVFFLVFPLFLLYGFLVITLDLERPVPAYLPVWVILSIAVGFGWWKLLSSGSWQGFAIAIVLSTSPLVIYRFAPMAVRQARMERRAEALLDAPVELPLDPLAFQLNPDRRDLQSARDFASGALGALPENATVLSPMRLSELLVSPIRYLSEVESAGSITFVSLGDDPEQRLRELTSPSSAPVYVKGLYPAHPAITALLASHHFRAQGEWFQLVPQSSLTDRTFVDAPIEGVTDDALGDEQLLGRWYGYVKPFGYPLTVWVQGSAGNLTGTAVLNEEGARPKTGHFNRLSSTVGAVLGSVEYGEAGTDQVHFHIDATERGNRLEGTWNVFEIPELEGEFVQLASANVSSFLGRMLR